MTYFCNQYKLIVCIAGLITSNSIVAAEPAAPAPNFKEWAMVVGTVAGAVGFYKLRNFLRGHAGAMGNVRDTLLQKDDPAAVRQYFLPTYVDKLRVDIQVAVLVQPALNQKALPCIKTDGKYNPFFHAAKWGRLQALSAMTDELTKKGINPRDYFVQLTSQGQNILEVAAQRCRPEIVRYLVDQVGMDYAIALQTALQTNKLLNQDLADMRCWGFAAKVQRLEEYAIKCKEIIEFLTPKYAKDPRIIALTQRQQALQVRHKRQQEEQLRSAVLDINKTEAFQYPALCADEAFQRPIREARARAQAVQSIAPVLGDLQY